MKKASILSRFPTVSPSLICRPSPPRPAAGHSRRASGLSVPLHHEEAQLEPFWFHNGAKSVCEVNAVSSEAPLSSVEQGETSPIAGEQTPSPNHQRRRKDCRQPP